MQMFVAKKVKITYYLQQQPLQVEFSLWKSHNLLLFVPDNLQ